MTSYLSTEDVLRLHTMAHGCAGDLSCIGDLGLIGAAAARPRATLLGIDAYPDLWLKAAALLHSLAASQGFTGGNKPTAWQCAWTFLGLGGQVLSASYDTGEAEQFLLGIDSHTTLDSVAGKLRSFAESEGKN